jgi:hypothetical protein
VSVIGFELLGKKGNAGKMACQFDFREKSEISQSEVKKPHEGAYG